MDWRAKVELFEQIRREYEFGVGTIVGVAQKLGVHRRMVREAIGSALPKPRKKTRTSAMEAESGGRVCGCDSGSGPQGAAQAAAHGTSHLGADSAGAAGVQDRRADGSASTCTSARLRSGMMARETCVPQSYAWGVEAQVDWYEAYADLSG